MHLIREIGIIHVKDPDCQRRVPPTTLDRYHGGLCMLFNCDRITCSYLEVQMYFLFVRVFHNIFSSNI